MLATHLVAIVSLFPASLALGEIIHVPADAPTIQACINAAVSGQDECVVAPGTYNELINFNGKAITLRSSGGRDVTTIDGTGLAGSVVKCIRGEGSATVLHGFTITGGTGTDTVVSGAGGGILSLDSSPVVKNCTIIRNTAYLIGGGMFNRGGSPTVIGCDFVGNKADTGTTATDYGGGFASDSGRPTINRCLFKDNGADYGGGIYSYAPSAPTVTNCVFIGNIAVFGGGMLNHSSSPTISNCTFVANRASNDGGGVYSFFGDPNIANCAFHGNTATSHGGGLYNTGNSSVLANCEFVGNTADTGGGLAVSAGSPHVLGCTFAWNSANFGGGIRTFVFGSATVNGCIVRGNEPDEVAVDQQTICTLGFSDVQGSLPPRVVDSGGNIDLDPMFVANPYDGGDGLGDNPYTPTVDEGANDDYGDLRLQPGSPCINTGDPDFTPADGETDLDGHARVLCGQVDMGAYEFGIADYDCDQAVDLTDFATWGTCMLGPDDGPYGHGCESFDGNLDFDVDLRDFAVFQNSLTNP